MSEAWSARSCVQFAGILARIWSAPALMALWIHPQITQIKNLFFGLRFLVSVFGC